jgi:hypothetical protein
MNELKDDLQSDIEIQKTIRDVDGLEIDNPLRVHFVKMVALGALRELVEVRRARAEAEGRVQALEALLSQLVVGASSDECQYCHAKGGGDYSVIHTLRCPITRAETLLQGES